MESKMKIKIPKQALKVPYNITESIKSVALRGASSSTYTYETISCKA